MVSNIDIKNKIASLPAPAIVKEKSYDELLNENIETLKEYLPDYQPLESDRYMKLIRVLTWKQFLCQANRNETIKSLLITTATGSDLDNLVAYLGVFRLQGSKPYANYEFKLSKQLDDDFIIPAGLELINNDNTYKASLLEDVVIKAGDTKAIGKVELQAFIQNSDVKTEFIITPLPFVVEAKALENFANGAENENDERLRIRAIRSLGRFSTAGSVGSYLYWIYSADSRIDDAVVFGNKGTLEVNIYLYSKSGVDAVMIDRVEEALSSEKVRPLGDDVSVYPAEILKVDLQATIYLFDISKEAEVDKQIKENISNFNFVIGQHLTRTQLIKNLQVAGVYKVETDFKDIQTLKTQIIEIQNISLSYREVEL